MWATHALTDLQWGLSWMNRNSGVKDLFWSASTEKLTGNKMRPTKGPPCLLNLPLHSGDCSFQHFYFGTRLSYDRLSHHVHPSRLLFHYSLVFQMPNFQPRDLRGNPWHTQPPQECGPPLILEEVEEVVWPCEDTRPLDTPPTSDQSQSTRDPSYERPPSGPAKGPSSSTNRSFPFTNFSEPDRYTRYDNPT